MKAGNPLLLDALGTAVEQTRPGAAQITFRHPLAITQAARRIFDVGPFKPGGYDGTVNAYFTRSNVDIGASFRQIADVADWDRSVATNAPGQSEWPRSPHFSDLATLWSAGEYFPLSFSGRAIQANVESTLTLQPR
jgi:penicillin G amidase